MNGQGSFQLRGLAWGVFAVCVVILLAIDLWTTRRKRSQSRKAAFWWSVVWVGAGVLFGGFVWILFGSERAHEYFAAYLMEKGLSLDNLFIFLIIFQTFGIEDESAQRKALLWGILGAIVLRGIFIFLGTAALERWSWASYIFGALLLFAAWSAFRKSPVKREKSPVAEWLAKRFPVKDKAEHGHFIGRKNGGWAATPLLLALVAIELSDLMFAIDSVPAALSITRNRFVVYSSNIFAILGLRALFLLLSQSLAEMRYLRYGLAAVLVFAGLKMISHDWITIPPLASVSVIIVALGAAVWASLRARNQEANASQRVAL